MPHDCVAGSSSFFKGGIEFTFSLRQKMNFLRKSFLTTSLESFTFGLGQTVHENAFPTVSDTGGTEELYDLLLTSPESLRYKKLVGAKEKKLQSATK